MYSFWTSDATKQKDKQRVVDFFFSISLSLSHSLSPFLAFCGVFQSTDAIVIIPVIDLYIIDWNSLFFCENWNDERHKIDVTITMMMNRSQLR